MISGRSSSAYFIAMVLSHSRKKYVEWFDRPVDTEMFINFHQNAFRAFEGVPEEVVYDQTKLAVIQENYGEVEFNESFNRYALWCKYDPYICRKFDPETKGKVEAVVKYIKHGFLPGRRFEDFGDLNSQWHRWLNEVGDVKVHETAGEPPYELWLKEKEHLKPFKEGRFPNTESFKIHNVNQDGLVKVLGNRYSVPSAHHGSQIKVRVTEEKAELRNLEGDHLFSHWRSLEKGKRFIERSHYRKEYKIPTEELTEKLISLYGDEKVAELLKKNFPRHYREQCKRLNSLEDKFDKKILRKAAESAITHRCVSYKNIKNAARHLSMVRSKNSAEKPSVQGEFKFPQDMGLSVRDLNYYDDVTEAMI